MNVIEIPVITRAVTLSEVLSVVAEVGTFCTLMVPPAWVSVFVDYLQNIHCGLYLCRY